MFIELTKTDNSKILVNTDKIVDVTRDNPEPYVGHTIVVTEKGRYTVKESYADVKDMITREPAAIVHVGTRELDQLYEDAGNGICSNDYYVPLDAEDVDALDKTRAKIFSSVGVPLRYILNKKDLKRYEETSRD